jgi:hypothetical protein
MGALKSRILIDLTGRYLSEREADQVRAEVAAMKPKTHLILPRWRWLEVRGLSPTKAAQLLEELHRLGLRFTVKGEGMSQPGQAHKRAIRATPAQTAGVF